MSFVDRRRIALLWLFGFAAIPVSMVPAQVLNALTRLFADPAPVAFGTILLVSLLYLASLAGDTLLRIGDAILNGRLVEETGAARSLHLFRAVLRTDPAFFRGSDAAAIGNRIIRDVRDVAYFQVTTLARLPVLGAAIAAYGWVLFAGIPPNDIPLLENFQQRGNWFLALIVFLMAPLQLLFLVFDRRIRAILSESATTDDRLHSTAQEILDGLPDLRTHFGFPYAHWRLHAALRRVADVETRRSRGRAWFQGIGPLIETAMRCLLLLVGARLCMGELELWGGLVAERIAWSDFIGFSLMSVTFGNQVNMAVQEVLRWRLNVPALERVREYEALRPAFDFAGEAAVIDPGDRTLRFESVGYETETGVRILDDIDLEVAPGEKIALVGPSGSGKSTLLQLVLRAIEPSAGCVRIGRTPVAAHDFASLTEVVAHVRQRPAVLDIGLRDNILLGAGATALAREAPPPGSEAFFARDPARDARIFAAARRTGFDDDLVRIGLGAPADALPGELAPRELRERMRALYESGLVPLGLDDVLAEERARAPSGEPETLREALFGPPIGEDGEDDHELVHRILVDHGLEEAVMGLALDWSPGEDGKRLSEGQKAKLALVRLMMKDPAIVLLDEVTAPLDERSQSRVVRMLEEFCAGRSVIAVSHRLATIRSFDRVVVMEEGRIVQQGTYAELVARPGPFRDLAMQEDAGR